MKDAALTVEDMQRFDELLEQVPREDWPVVWYVANHRVWPEELGTEPKEHGVFLAALFHLISKIEMHCGLKACLRVWHNGNFGKSDQEFEDWWESQSIADFPGYKADSVDVWREKAIAYGLLIQNSHLHLKYPLLSAKGFMLLDCLSSRGD